MPVILLWFLKLLFLAGSGIGEYLIRRLHPFRPAPEPTRRLPLLARLDDYPRLRPFMNEPAP